VTDKAMLMVDDGGGGEARRIGLTEDATSLGRWEDSDVVLDHREVSRRHAIIRHERGRYVLVDLGSKNGTSLNGSRVDGAAPLRDGDEILVPPHFRLVFVDHEATVPAAGLRRGVRLDPKAREVFVAGTRLEPPLAPNQFALIRLLSSQPGKVYTRDEIAAACYPEAEPGSVSDQAIDGIVRRLRTRMANVDPEGEHIVAVRGHGFRLVAPVVGQAG